MESPTANAFLADFLKVRPYILGPTDSEDVEDEPSFTVDERYQPLEEPPYMEELPINSALLG